MKTNVVCYEVFCFSRMLQVYFKDEVDKQKVLDLMDEAYCDWHQNDVCMTCEDYITEYLESKGYVIDTWDSTEF